MSIITKKKSTTKCCGAFASARQHKKNQNTKNLHEINSMFQKIYKKTKNVFIGNQTNERKNKTKV